MGFWAGIKHALNSTLGTADFKPLDEIIKGQKSLLASDNLYCVLPAVSFENLTEDSYASKKVIKFKCKGSIKLVVGNTTAYIDFKMYKNDVEFFGTRWSADVDIPHVINIEEGDVISFGVQKIPTYPNESCTIQTVEIYADIIDNSLIELV